MMQLDVLAFGAHPDDVELGCSGTLFKLKQQGKRIGVVDLTRGELGTRGTPQTRELEAADAARILQLDVRHNLDLGDGWFTVDQENILRVIQMIRLYRPRIVIANALSDRHTDHPKGAELVKQAFFLSGLRKIETEWEGEAQEAYRPDHLFHYIQFFSMQPTFVVDITDEFETKMESVMAYKTQFFGSGSSEPETPISSKRFIDSLESRAREMGTYSRTTYAEGFVCETPLSYDLDIFL